MARGMSTAAAARPVVVRDAIQVRLPDALGFAGRADDLKPRGVHRDQAPIEVYLVNADRRVMDECPERGA